MAIVVRRVADSTITGRSAATLAQRTRHRLGPAPMANEGRGVYDYELNVQDYIRVFRRGWYLLVGTVVVFIAVAYGLTSLQSERYRSTADVLVGVQQGSSVIDSAGTQFDRGDQLETEVAFIESAVVRDAVREQEGSAPRVDARTVGQASVIEIRVEGGDPIEAARFAAAYSDVYIELRRQRAVDEYLATAQVVQDRIDDIDDTLGELADDDPQRSALESQRVVYLSAIESLALGADLSGGVTAQVISPANVPANPFSPNPTRNAILGGIVGMAVGLALVLLRETLDDRVRTKADLETASGLPTLAVIPNLAEWKRRDEERVVSLEGPASDTAEAYRTLRTALQFFSLDRSIRTVQVTSANAGEGKSTTVVNLAIVLARTGQRVVVIDGDLRNPRVHRFFEVKRRPGLTDVLLGETRPRAAAVPPPKASDLSVLVIPAGRPTTNPSEALGGRTARELIETLAGAADVVLVDSPPVLPVADALVLAGQVDAVLLVAQAGRAKSKQIERATELLNQVNAPLLGAILNDATRSDGFGYGYGYGYPVREDAREGKRRRSSMTLFREDEADPGTNPDDEESEALFPAAERDLG